MDYWGRRGLAGQLAGRLLSALIRHVSQRNWTTNLIFTRNTLYPIELERLKKDYIPFIFLITLSSHTPIYPLYLFISSLYPSTHPLYIYIYIYHHFTPPHTHIPWAGDVWYPLHHLVGLYFMLYTAKCTPLPPSSTHPDSSPIPLHLAGCRMLPSSFI